VWLKRAVNKGGGRSHFQRGFSPEGQAGGQGKREKNNLEQESTIGEKKEKGATTAVKKGRPKNCTKLNALKGGPGGYGRKKKKKKKIRKRERKKTKPMRVQEVTCIPSKRILG